MARNINDLVTKILNEGNYKKYTKKDIMTPAQMEKLLKPECIQKGEEFDCKDLGYDKEADKLIKG